jgi:uncharacterized damage-inducible protein DinB
MLDREGALSLVRYKAWADELTLTAAAALPPGELVRERATAFKTIIATLNHSYVVDLIWQANLDGREHGFSTRRVIVHPEIATLTAAQKKANEWLAEWADAQTDSSLRSPVSFKLVSGEAGTLRRGEILLHIVNHATYHRGFVSDLFYQIPVKPPTTDWNVYLQRAAR